MNVSDKAWKLKIVNRGCASGPQGDIPCWIVDCYVTGQSDGPTGYDFVTVHYTETGEQLWANRYNGSGTSMDAAYDISVRSGYPIMYSGGVINNNYGIIGITDSRTPRDLGSDGISVNYPNPFNPETKISFNLAGKSFVRLVVYDVLGRQVKELVNREIEQGLHDITWNAAGSTSGVYFYKIETAFGNETKKMVLIR